MARRRSHLTKKTAAPAEAAVRGCSLKSEPFFLLEEDKAHDHDGNADCDDERIGDFVFQFRHIFEVHAVPARDQRQRHEDRGDDRQQRHDPVLPDIELGLVKIADLDREIAQRGRQIMQPRHTLRKQMKIARILLFEEIVFVFLQLLTQIQKLLVMDAHIAEIAAGRDP